MKTRHAPFHEAKKRKTAGPPPFAAVCVMALAAFGTIACSGRGASRAPPPMSHETAPAASLSTGPDPSLPSTARALKGRVFDEGEPAPTF